MDHTERDKRRRALAKRFKAGESIEALQAGAGIEPDTLNNYLRTDCPMEWKRRKQFKPSAIRRESVKELSKQKMSCSEIARHLGYPLTTILKDCELLGIKVPRARKHSSQQRTTVFIVADLLSGLTDKKTAKRRNNTVARVTRIRQWMNEAGMIIQRIEQ